MAFKVKLHLGCGQKLLPGWINCDLADNAYGVKPNIACDITNLCDFPDNYADAIMAIHVFEHFWILEVDDIIEEWKRVLKPGGKLILEVPCLDKILKFFAEEVPRPQYTLHALYGDPRTFKSSADLHKWCWSETALVRFLEHHGLKEVNIVPAQYHVPERDLRVEAIK